MGQHAMAVVDDGFEVPGLDGLRVIDASVMPAVHLDHTNAPTIIIAEKVPRSSRVPHGKKLVA
jgi:choline dehydrogenase